MSLHHTLVYGGFSWLFLLQHISFVFFFCRYSYNALLTKFFKLEEAVDLHVVDRKLSLYLTFVTRNVDVGRFYIS
jgi:hypothetical protein